MKVICINAGPIRSKGILSIGGGLVEGIIYTSIGEHTDEDNEPCYIIEELINEPRIYGGVKGSKLKSRFRIIDTDWIDEAIEKALNEEPELVNT
jgi:hypothetical protein